MSNSSPDLISDDTRPGMLPGDAAALLRQWFIAHLRTVGRALAWFGVTLREDRADLAQDVFFAAYLALLRGEDIDNPRAWLRECARKHASNHRHKELRRRAPPRETPTGAAHDPERIAAERERLRRAFASLDEDAQGIVFDVRADEVSWGEVARERGITIDQARYLYQRAVTQMEEVLKRDDSNEKERRSIGPPIALSLLEGSLRAEADDVSPDTRRRIWDSLEQRMDAASPGAPREAPYRAPRLEIGATLGLLGGGIAIGVVIGYLLRGPLPAQARPPIAAAPAGVAPGTTLATSAPLQTTIASASPLEAPPEIPFEGPAPPPRDAATAPAATRESPSFRARSHAKGLSASTSTRARSGSMTLLDYARAALASGDVPTALAQLALHARRFPAGQDARARRELHDLACAAPEAAGAQECTAAVSSAPD
jgi:DNA-directed RNA polymerase specialized sigma24 family protein